MRNGPGWVLLPPAFLGFLFRWLLGFFRRLLGSLLGGLLSFLGGFLRRLLGGRFLRGCFLFGNRFLGATASTGGSSGFGFGRGGRRSRRRRLTQRWFWSAGFFLFLFLLFKIFFERLAVGS